jgi:hypothetical protein
MDTQSDIRGIDKHNDVKEQEFLRIYPQSARA